MRRLTVLLGIICLVFGTSCATAGDTTDNGYFFLPSLGAKGAAERTTWLNSLRATDTVLHAMRSAPYWTNGSNSTLTGEADLEAADLTVTGAWDIGSGKFEAPNGTSLVTADCDSDSEAGRVFVKTNGDTGEQLYICEGTLGWVQSSGGGGGGGGTNGWTESGTNIYLTDSTDSVGLGTTAPQKRIDINGSDPSIILKDTDNTATNYRWVVRALDNGFANGTNFWIQSTTNNGASYNTDGIYMWPIGGIGFGTTDLTGKKMVVRGLGTSTGTTFETQNSSGTSLVKFYDDGNVGIGSTSPRGKLDVGSGTIYAGTLNTGSGAGVISATSGISIKPDGSNTKMSIASGGNVGIGTTTASVPLHVVGNVRVTGLASCDTIDTDSSGNLACGTDGGGGGGGGGWTDGGTTVYNDTASDSVAIGTTSPGSGGNAGKLMVYTDTNGMNQLSVHNPNSGTAAQSRINLISASANGLLGIYPTNYVSNNFFQGRLVLQSETGVGIALATNSGSGSISFAPGGSTEKGRWDSSGNLGIGTTAPIGRLDVRGDEARIWTGSGNNNNATSAGELYVEGDIEGDGNAYVNGDLTVTGDDIFMATNTSGYAMVADGTNFNPTAISGDITLSGSGVTTIQPNAVTLATDTIGNYVGNIADGTGIDGTVSEENATYTPTLDLTEISSLTWGSGAFTTMTFNSGATDPVLTAGDGYLSLTTGNIGIGTTIPVGKLNVVGDEVRIWTGAGTDNNANGSGELYVEGDLEVDGVIYGNGSGITGITEASGWTDGGTTVSLITSSDKVGIGTTSATGKLEVVGLGTTSSTSSLVIKNSAGSSILTLTDDGTLTTTGTGDSYASGNFGIGSTSPRSILDVKKASGVGQATLDGTTGGCLMLRDTDNAGWTECDALDGTLSCSIDADGICD